LKIIWTKHAEQRQKEWERKKGVTKEEVEEYLRNPDQIVSGDMDSLIAQSRYQHGLLRIPFKETKEGRKILTVYWTSKIEKYWKEDK